MFYVVSALHPSQLYLNPTIICHPKNSLVQEANYFFWFCFSVLVLRNENRDEEKVGIQLCTCNTGWLSVPFDAI